MNYETQSGDSVPTDVSEQFDSPEEWERCDPTNVWVHDSLIGPLYEGIVDGERRYVSDGGYPYRADHYDYVKQRTTGTLPAHCETPLSYREDVSVVHHDHYVEHVTKAIVVTRAGRCVLGSRSGIVWCESYRGEVSPSELSTEALQLGTALLDADTGIEKPDRYEQALGGWHSSLEQSEQSDMMNALTDGDLPDHMEQQDMYPYVVRYGNTRNVCSVNASVYGNAQFCEQICEEFAGTRSRPGYARFS